VKNTVGNLLAKEASRFIKKTTNKKPYNLRHLIVAVLLSGFIANGRSDEEAVRNSELLADRLRDV